MRSGVYTITNDEANRTSRPPMAPHVVVEATSSDHQQQQEQNAMRPKTPYPRSIGTLLGSMFFERAAMNGMKTVLIIYLTTQLAYDTDQATMVYHSYMTLVFLTSIFGAIVSDSWLGKYNTVMLMYVLGLIGMAVLSLSTVHTNLLLPGREMTIVALVILALGTGCMKPCILAFGGDQFRVPEQLNLMSAYFSMVFFTLKVSSFVGTALTPMLRTDVKCFGQESCYLLAFGVSGGILLASMVCFLLGKCLYVVRPSSGNIIVQVVKCITRALVLRLKSTHHYGTSPTHTTPLRATAAIHWLDYSESRYGKQLVHDTKILLNVLVLYLPIPFYWALNEQTGSRWTLQASRMIGDLFGYYTIKPDQMQIAMQVLLIAFIPLFQTVLYPLLARIGIRRPLQKIALAMALAGTAFVLAGYVEMRVADDYAVLPAPNSCQLRVYNTWPHEVRVVQPKCATNGGAADEMIVINGLDAMQSIVPLVAFNSSNAASAAAKLHIDAATTSALPLIAGQAVSYYFDGRTLTSFVDSPRKATSQRPRLRILVVWAEQPTGSMPLTLYDMNEHYTRYRRTSDNIEQFELAATRYTVRIGDQVVTDRLQLERGSVSTLLVRQRPTGSSGFDVNLVQLTPPNSVHMLWMLPQYALLAAGEAIMGVTGMYFAYSEAPESMKTVLQACWLLTIALGHLIDVIVVGANFINSQILEFFMFAGLMYIIIFIFMWLASRYQPLSAVAVLSTVVTSAPDGKVPQKLAAANLPRAICVKPMRI